MPPVPTFEVVSAAKHLGRRKRREEVERIVQIQSDRLLKRVRMRKKQACRLGDGGNHLVVQ
jgi:hypothetical protein